MPKDSPTPDIDPVDVTQSAGEAPRGGWLGLFFLRPYGKHNLSTFAAISIGAAWVLIMIMATVEGAIWASISRYLVPEVFAFARPVVAALMFLIIFIVIWTVDAMLIMYTRPEPPRRQYRYFMAQSRGPAIVSRSAAEQGDAEAARQAAAERKPQAHDVLKDRRGQTEEQRKFWLGILVRVSIIALSLIITASFLEQAIREDEILKEYEAARREVRTTKVAGVEAGENARIATLTEQKQSPEQTLKDLRTERDKAVGSLREEITALEDELAKWRREAELERTGADGRAPGKGANWRAAVENADRIEQELADKRAERDRRAATFETSITDYGQRVAAIDAQMTEAQERLDSVRDDANDPTMSLEDFARKYALQVPREGLGTRVEMLRRIKARESVPFIESVKGLSSAFLGLLFLALVAIKLFEPRSMRLYYDEALQRAYREYKAGRFDHVPGFDPPDAPRGLSYEAFAESYAVHRDDPDFFHDHEFDRAEAAYWTQELDINARLREQAAQSEEDRKKLSEAFQHTEQAKRTDYELEKKRKGDDITLQKQRADLQQQRAKAAKALWAERAEKRQQFEERRAELEQLKQRLTHDLERLAEADRLREERLASDTELERRRLDTVAERIRADNHEKLLKAELAHAIERRDELVAAIDMQIDATRESRNAFYTELTDLKTRNQALDSSAAELKSRIETDGHDLSKLRTDLEQLRQKAKRIRKQLRTSDSMDDDEEREAEVDLNACKQDISKTEAEIARHADVAAKQASAQQELAEVTMQSDALKKRIHVVEEAIERCNKEEHELQQTRRKTMINLDIAVARTDATARRLAEDVPA
jgi:hypothetical protein